MPRLYGLMAKAERLVVGLLRCRVIGRVVLGTANTPCQVNSSCSTVQTALYSSLLPLKGALTGSPAGQHDEKYTHFSLGTLNKINSRRLGAVYVVLLVVFQTAYQPYGPAAEKHSS